MASGDANLKNELEERLRFETLIADLSSQFVNLPAGEVDREIGEAQRRICELLGLDIAALWQWSDEAPGVFTLTHYYAAAQELPQPPAQAKAHEVFPWFQKQMLAGRVVAISSLDEMPAEAARDREAGRQLGVKSNLTIPLSVGGGRPVGVWGLNTTRAERDWPGAVVKRLQLLAQIFANALARKRTDQALHESQERLRLTTEDLEDRLKFENLISALSARMVVTASTEVDQEIERALDTLLRFFRCERCGLLEVIREENVVRITHARYAEGVEEVSKTLNLAAPFPWAVPRMIDLGQHVSFSSVDELPAEAAVDRASWVGMGTKSSLNIPIQSRGCVRHLMVIHSIREERQWPESYIPRLRMLGEIFANAVERRRADQALRESEARLSLAAEAAESGLWVLDLRTKVFWVTEKTREIFGYPPGEVLSLERFQASVHPQDWGRVQDSLERAMKVGEPVNVEYRIRLGDGRERWIASRGRPHLNPAGKPERLMGVSVDITERKQTDRALRTSEGRLAAAAELAGLGHYEVDYGAGTCFLDQQFRQICGVPAEAKEGLDPVVFWQEHVHHDDKQRVLDQRQKLHEGRVGQISTEYRYLHPVFGVRWIHHLARIADQPTGVGVRSFGVIRDITERKRAAELQAEDLQFWALIADLSSRFVNLPPGEVDGAIEDGQRRVCEFLGLDLSALWQAVEETAGDYRLTHHYRSMGGPPITRMSAKESFPWCHQQLMAGKVIAVASMDELPLEAARDQEVWRHFGIKTSLTLPLSAGGGPAIGFLSFNDIRKERDWPEVLVHRLQFIAQMFTNALARRRSDESLRESVEINRATFEQAAVGIAHVGTDGRWLRVNDRLCAILGHSRQELMKLSFQDITHPDDLETDLNLVRQVRSGEIKSYSMEKRYLRRDRSIVWVTLAVSLVRTASGAPSHFIAVVEDITDRKKAEAELIKGRAELAHAARVSTLGELAASVAHELNQPLGAILANAEAAELFLEQDPPAINELRPILAAIRKDDERAAEVIRRMRTLLRKRELERHPIDINSLAEDVMQLVSGDAALRRVSLTTDLAPTLPEVSGDRVHLQQVLLNLVLNGMDAMGDQPPENRHISVRTHLAAEGQVELAVIDSGPGIGVDALPHIFEPFYTTKPSGMGMGLSIARTIIEAHHGRIWAENKASGGTVLHIALPAAQAGEGSGPESSGFSSKSST